jgi:uncharacterized membrane protein
MDTPKRSLVKALVWELTGIITLLIVGALVFGLTKQVGLLTVVFYFIRILMFVAHEQVWTRWIRWGKVRRPHL